MDYNMAGEDASLDAAVAAITAKIQATPAEQPEDRRPVGHDADVTEYDGSTDLEELEKAQANDAAEVAEPDDQSESGTEAVAEGDDLFELPPAAEGEEAVKIPRAEAIEAVRAYRQIQGNIADAINQAEAKYQSEQDQIIQGIVQAHDVVIDRAEAALRMMPRPQMPSEQLLNPQSQYYDPEAYHVAKINYDRQVEVIRQIQHERTKAQTERDQVASLQEQAQNAREHERLARVWPEWKDEAKREAKTQALLDGAEKVLGIPRDVMQKMPFHHKVMQALDEALKAKQAPVKAAEVKKVIQEKAPKMVNGRAPLPAREQNGRFVNEARQALKETGSEDAFAQYLLKSGALKQRR